MSARHLSVLVTLLAAASVCSGWCTSPLLRHCRLPSQLPRLAMTETVGTGISTAASSSLPDYVEVNTWGTPQLSSPDEEECEIEFVDPEEDAALWPWRFLLLAVTGTWGANFAAMKLASDALGGTPEAVTLFLAARFSIAFALLSPSLLRITAMADPMAVVTAGASVGALATFGYATQAAALAMGTHAGTAAFICSLNTVVVALLVGKKTGCISPRTWWAADDP